jgi:hypothetical protein
VTDMTATEQHTEASMLSLLRKRHAAKGGNGPEWAYLEKVRDAPGFDARRTADAMALGLWHNRGCELHGFEIKVSRADWRRELAELAKADGWRDRRSLSTWGLLETGARGSKRDEVALPTSNPQDRCPNLPVRAGPPDCESGVYASSTTCAVSGCPPGRSLFPAQWAPRSGPYGVRS